MNQNILDYIRTQRVGVLAVEMMDGSPHAASLHFAHTENPFVFYFKTHREYRKTEALFAREKTRASFVIGSDENNMKTFQADGIAELIKPEEKEIIDSAFFGKFPEKKKTVEDPKGVFFKFTPHWWRFTDWTTPQGKMIWTSN